MNMNPVCHIKKYTHALARMDRIVSIDDRVFETFEAITDKPNLYNMCENALAAC